MEENYLVEIYESLLEDIKKGIMSGQKLIYSKNLKWVDYDARLKFNELYQPKYQKILSDKLSQELGMNVVVDKIIRESYPDFGGNKREVIATIKLE